MRDQDALAALRVVGMSKSFGTVEALSDVSLAVASGSIHALLGRNGSGKSTLIKILSGFHVADAGEVRVAGERLGITSDRVALGADARSRIGFVHQDLAVLPRLSVMENVVIGREYPTRRGRIDWSALRASVRASLAPFGLDDRVDRPLGSLTKGEAAIVAIARALYSREDMRLLVLDEPTSALPVAERAPLFRTMRELADRGLGVLFVTHHLDEATAISDDATVLRDGKVVPRRPRAALDEASLVRDMVGTLPPSRPAPRLAVDSAGHGAGTTLRLEAATGSILQDVSIEVRTGEIVAAVGLLGSGLEELALIASGRQRPARGQATLERDGELTPLTGLVSSGTVGLVPSERLTHALLARSSVRENITIARPERHLVRGILSRRSETAAASAWASTLGIVPSDPEIPIGRLSGGNQQKAVLARWLAVEPLALIAAEPTQGVDLAAKRDLLAQLRRTAASCPVLVISHEPEEILPICDRIVVIKDGKAVASVPRADAAIDTLLQAFA